MKNYVDFSARKGKNDSMLLDSSNRPLSRLHFPLMFLFSKIQDADSITLLVLCNTYLLFSMQCCDIHYIRHSGTAKPRQSV